MLRLFNTNFYKYGGKWGPIRRIQNVSDNTSTLINALFTAKFKHDVIKSPLSSKFGIRIYTYDLTNPNEGYCLSKGSCIGKHL